MSHNASQQPGGGRRLGEEWLTFESSSNKISWMVSYADIMTIILTFFVLLLSIATIAQNEFDLLVESITGHKVGNLRDVQTHIDKVIDQQGLDGQISTKIDRDGLKIQFDNALLFDSGSAELTPQAAEILAPISADLAKKLQPTYGITIEGYTDDVPISNERFRSNWELSTSRAINVMRRLRETGFDSKRMSIQGFADTRAATGIDLHDAAQTDKLTPEQLQKVRAANRRVVLRIHPLSARVIAKLHLNTHDSNAPDRADAKTARAAKAAKAAKAAAPTGAFHAP